jgi:hypothetical protein
MASENGLEGLALQATVGALAKNSLKVNDF